MHDLTTFPTTDPVGLYRVRDGMYAGDMLLTALVHLDLFTRLDRQPATKAEICGAFNIVDRPADAMLTLRWIVAASISRRRCPCRPDFRRRDRQARVC
jgi:hypothetical protein